jgi:hypothetical protein
MTEPIAALPNGQIVVTRWIGTTFGMVAAVFTGGGDPLVLLLLLLDIGSRSFLKYPR